jgi:hypothetical protein
MNDTQETADDILREMRERSADENDALGRYADRLEQALDVERHRDTIYGGYGGQMTLDLCIKRCEDNSTNDMRGRDIGQIAMWLRELRDRRNGDTCGNSEAMRATLVEAMRLIAVANDEGKPTKMDAGFLQDAIYTQAEDALAIPPRACDILPKEELVDTIIDAIYGVTGFENVSEIEKSLARDVVETMLEIAYNTEVAKEWKRKEGIK